MLKKISLVIVSLFCLVALSAPAAIAECPIPFEDQAANGDAYLTQGQFGINSLMSGFSINPLAITYSETEVCDNECCNCDYAQNAGLDWGGVNIDLLIVQGLGQGQMMGSHGEASASGMQSFNNSLSLDNSGMKLNMSQEATQFGTVESSGYEISTGGCR